MTISIELGVDRKLLLNMLSDGMDYVCRGYWGQIEAYKWYWWYVCGEDGEPIDPYTISPDLTDESTLIRLRDDEDGLAEKENRPWTDITFHNLEQAFGWTLKHYPHTLSSYEVDKKSNTIVDCDYDAITCDIMLQYIVFGEVIYG